MQDDPVARVYGSWGSGKRRGGRGRRSTDAVIDALRGRADAR